MLCKGVKGKLAGGMGNGELLAEITKGAASHTLSLLYGGAAALVNSAGVPWTAAYVDSHGEPTADLRSNIAAEARAKIIYERLINVTDDASVKDALGFLMTREIAHQKSFEKALYAIEPNFPPGKLPGMPQFTNPYFDMSQGLGDMQGPWNTGALWQQVNDRKKQAAVGATRIPAGRRASGWRRCWRGRQLWRCSGALGDGERDYPPTCARVLQRLKHCGHPDRNLDCMGRDARIRGGRRRHQFADRGAASTAGPYPLHRRSA